jgi:hypothetical protein
VKRGEIYYIVPPRAFGKQRPALVIQSTLFLENAPSVTFCLLSRSVQFINPVRILIINERGLAVSKLFPLGTLVMTIAANIGDVAILDFEACFPDSVVGFVPSARVERDFLYYMFVAMKPELLREAPVNTQGNSMVSDRFNGYRLES